MSFIWPQCCIAVTGWVHYWSHESWRRVLTQNIDDPFASTDAAEVIEFLQQFAFAMNYSMPPYLINEEIHF